MKRAYGAGIVLIYAALGGIAAACGGAIAVGAEPKEDAGVDAGSDRGNWMPPPPREDPPPAPTHSPPTPTPPPSSSPADMCAQGAPADPLCTGTPPSPMTETRAGTFSSTVPTCAPESRSCAEYSATATVVGSVVDCEGQPIANARVSADGSMGSGADYTECTAATRTDQNGQFRLNVPGAGNFDYGWGPFDVFVETPNGNVVATVRDAYSCPTYTCAIAVP